MDARLMAHFAASEKHRKNAQNAALALLAKPSDHR
jgi:hypothetical protein